MTFGLTSNGFNMKRLSDIAQETKDDFVAEFGPQINLSGQSPMGQIKGILDNGVSELWEVLQAVYDSQNPQTAEAISLDNIAALTGVTRLPATFSTVTARVFGTLNTLVPAGFTLSVDGNADSKFLSILDDTIHAGIDEVQTITFSGTPTSGSFKLRFDLQETVAINWDDTNTEVQTALNNLSNLSSVVVTGDFATGFVVTFTGADGEQDQSLLEVFANTLDDGSPVTTSVVETTKGYLPFVDVQMVAENTGSVEAPANSLIIIETPIGGVDSAINLLDAVVGNELETDEELKARRIINLQRSGSATINGIRSNILEVENVLQAIVVENDQDITVSGRPPHSFESYVLGGDDVAIAQAIFDSKAAGIRAFGSITEAIVDSEGVSHDISFSRPVDVEIYMIVNITPNTDPLEGDLYPVDGDTLIVQSILDFVEDFEIGQDVVVNKLYTPINEVAGVIGIEILIGTSPSPSLSNNIAISATEVARFDSSRITVNS